MAKKKKRTISPEHLAKMQAGRKRARMIRKRAKELDERGVGREVPMGYTDRLLSQAKRRKKR
jgi:hypothetical protein